MNKFLVKKMDEQFGLAVSRYFLFGCARGDVSCVLTLRHWAWSQGAHEAMQLLILKRL
jgi:hypothetical protein